MLFAILSSCSLEYKIANSFVSQKNKATVLVLSPDLIYKTNLNDSLKSVSKFLNQQEINLLLIENSLFLKHLNEKNFVDISLDYLKDELILMGFQVYDENSFDQFMLAKDSSFILKLSQFELEEGYGERIQTNYFYDQAVNITALVNFVNINTWFELERKNIPDEKFPLLYSSYSLMDGVQADFKMNQMGQISYTYTIDSLSIKDFADVPEMLGKKYASYFYDYVLNIDIIEKLPTDKHPKYFFHYDPQFKNVYPLLNEGDHFIEIEE